MPGLGVAATVVAALAGLLGVVAFSRVVKREPDPFVKRVIVIGLFAKLAGTAVYYRVIADIYGSGDVTGYVRIGRSLAPIIRSGSLPPEARETGTRFMEFLAGVSFAAFGPSEIIGYVVFSMLSFVGMLLFFFAFRMALPDGDHRRYAVLVLLLPTMLFWPSTIGKEAWLVFTLGLASYGAARVLRRRPMGYVIVSIAVAGMGAVRPHMSALFAVSFAAAFLLRFRDKEAGRGAVGWMAGLVLLSFGTGFALINFSDEMGRTEADEATPITERLRADTEEVFERTDRLTRTGGGEFEGRPVRGPVDLAHALITVPFRPFLFEAHNLQALIAAIESLALLALFAVSIPRLVALPKTALSKPYVALAVIYSLGFIVAFSNVSNFGILTRQRAQLMPLLLVLLALPAARQRRTERSTKKAPVLHLHGGSPVHDGGLPRTDPDAATHRSEGPDTGRGGIDG